MAEELNRGESRSFTLILDLYEEEALTEDHDVIFTVKRHAWEPNENAIIMKRLRSNPPQLALQQTHGPDPETGEGNVAIVTGNFIPSDTAGLFAGTRSRAPYLQFTMEAGMMFEGAYSAKEQDTLKVVNTVFHVEFT